MVVQIYRNSRFHKSFWHKHKGITGIALALLVLVVTSSIWLSAISNWLTIPSTIDLQTSDVIAVHGGNPDRTDYAIALYHRNLAPELWQTGYARTQIVFREVIKNEPDPSAFRFLTTTSTWSDGMAIAQMIRERKVHSVIIVTDWWHSRRALCSTMEQLQGYPVTISFSASPSPAGPQNWWRNADIRANVLSELLKMVYYSIRYGWTPWGC